MNTTWTPESSLPSNLFDDTNTRPTTKALRIRIRLPP